MFHKAYIQEIAYYLPEPIYTNEDIARDFPEWPAQKVTSKLGIEKRHIARPEETSLDMAEKAGEKLLENSPVEKLDIDFLLLCTQSPDYFLPTSACILQDRLGLSTHCGALDYNLGCSGFVYGLALAKGLVASGIARNVLLITSETYSKFIHPLDKSNKAIFGDAATATLIGREGKGEIKEFSLGTDGKGANNLIVKTGALKHKDKRQNTHINESGQLISDDHLYMSGTDIFNFTLESVPELVKETLHKNNLVNDDINLYIFHQANQYMLEFLRKKLKIHPDHFPYFLKDVGNTVSSTIPLVLKESELQLKGNILLAGFGVGYSWGGVVINYKS